jgi:hypothetical protein
MEFPAAVTGADASTLQLLHAVVVRVRGKDSAEKRAIGRPVSIKM